MDLLEDLDSYSFENLFRKIDKMTSSSSNNSGRLNGTGLNGTGLNGRLNGTGLNSNNSHTGRFNNSANASGSGLGNRSEMKYENVKSIIDENQNRAMGILVFLLHVYFEYEPGVINP